MNKKATVSGAFTGERKAVESMHKRVRVLLSGPFAEAHFIGEKTQALKDGTEVSLWQRMLAIDIGEAEAQHRIVAWTNESAALVVDNWISIERVAKALLRDRRLSYSQVSLLAQ